MTNLTIRMEPEEKRQLSAWAASKGQNVTDYIKDLVAADMQAGSADSRAAAWLAEHREALADEARLIQSAGIPGAHLALHFPERDEDL
ncbi:hypothetical protein LR948_08110 [Roseivivax sp. GX 12232]|uniref:hypothetical protein n=1 Tax=Roseivivax sp. GX 12232 TaxID=2900547 RepID=UPI001E41C05B|nr:hypothetical protein [Roseivivax sp. GX 12232]MCE0505311.1 hypothetical protein [Roseivivax sp. GX 12232]